jgi:hypothetical protein
MVYRPLLWYNTSYMRLPASPGEGPAAVTQGLLHGWVMLMHEPVVQPSRPQPLRVSAYVDAKLQELTGVVAGHEHAQADDGRAEQNPVDAPQHIRTCSV